MAPQSLRNMMLHSTPMIESYIREKSSSGSSSRKSPVMAIGGEGGINVFDGEVTLGSLSIHPSSGSSIQDLPGKSYYYSPTLGLFWICPLLPLFSVIPLFRYSVIPLPFHFRSIS